MLKGLQQIMETLEAGKQNNTVLRGCAAARMVAQPKNLFSNIRFHINDSKWG